MPQDLNSAAPVCPSCRTAAIPRLGSAIFWPSPSRPSVLLHNILRYACPVCSSLIAILTPNYPALVNFLYFFPTVKSVHFISGPNSWFTDFSN